MSSGPLTKKLIRKPVAMANWKMAMTITESLTFLTNFKQLAGTLLDQIDIIICPPYTALWTVSQCLTDKANRLERLQLGAQDLAPTDNPAYTGEISAALLADVGCRWVMIGHWEVRRRRGENDAIANKKVHLALSSGIRPILLVGEAVDETNPQEAVIREQLDRVLADCSSEQVDSMILVYEPEANIGVSEPASVEAVSAGCATIRGHLRGLFGNQTADSVRIAYGGSVSPEHASSLLTIADLDGLGATRRGRDPVTFVSIVRQIAEAKY